MSGLLHSVQTPQVTHQPLLCREWELTGLVTKEYVSGGAAPPVTVFSNKDAFNLESS